MTAPLSAYGYCPACTQAVHYQATTALFERTAHSGAAPQSFDWQCPNCTARLTVKVLAAAPLLLRFDREPVTTDRLQGGSA